MQNLPTSYLKTDRNVGLISVDEFQHLLVKLSENNELTNIRFRVIGEMWQKNYCTLLNLTGNKLICMDTVTHTPLIIHNFRSIAQFELETGFQQYQRNFHYEVTPFKV